MLKFTRRALALFAALMLLGASLAEGLTFTTPAPTPTPILDSDRQDDGVVRVLLRSLGAPEALHLTVAGSYALEGDAGFRFARGAQLTLMADGDSLWMEVSGLLVNLGPSVTLTRHAADGENGLYIAQSEKDTLYMGDLTVSVRNGALRAVLSIGMEDYLRGVVAYEMSDSFPVEALKAQAVAARTYAMRQKYAAATRDYDVTDTTSDQVFKGYDPQYANVIAAVEATDGVVGVAADGGFAECYYTASNGGQIARPCDVWGGADDGCIEMHDDPYDLENPRSLVNSVEFAADLSDAAALRAMLTDALRQVNPEAELVSVANIEPTDPVTEGSRQFRQLRFDLNVTVPAPTPTPEPTPTPTPSVTPGASASPEIGATPAVTGSWSGWASFRESVEGTPTPSASAKSFLFLPTATPEVSASPEPPARMEATESVTLSVYEQIKENLGLGLNGSDYELITVREEEGRFALELRRFGHGTGMSQRGAQWMAGEYGMSWQEILGFYYPSMALERIDWDEPELTELTEIRGYPRPAPTPKPTPAPLPSPGSGESVAKVALSDAGSTLNIRESASANARILDRFENGREVLVCGEPDAEGWVKIRTAELTGYCKLEYLTTD